MMIWKSTCLTTFALAIALVGGCKDEHKHTADPADPAKPATAGATDDHPNAVSIGEATQNGLTLKAMQDEPLKAGKEAAFDVAISGFAEGQKPKSVRFWVGVEGAEEQSVKSRADEEKAGVWHTHVEVPSPIPADAKFWCEIEPATGEKFRASFKPVM